MNKFDKYFFKKYISEWQEIKWIVHIHFIEIFSYIFLWLSMWAILPSFIYFYSELIQDLIPFFILEWLLIIVYIKIIYEIFNWYNDVLIITDWWIVALEWALFKTDSISIEYDKIEWMEVEQDWILDKIFNKWNLVIHKFWDDSIILENTFKPYDWINLIEQVNEEIEETKNIHNEKYDIVMNALWWVVENYLEDKINSDNKKHEISKKIKKIEKKHTTIDLR